MDNLSYYDIVKKSLGLRERPFLDYVMSSIQDGNYFILAPTGYGKTAISMALSMREIEEGFKMVVSYPLRSLIEQQSWKFQNFMKTKGYMEVIGVRYMGRADSPYLVHPVTLTTVDNLSLMSLGLSPEDTQKVYKEYHGTTYGSLGHYMFSWASVFTASHVFDEVHLLADRTKSLSFLMTFLRLSKTFGNNVISMSATLPKTYRGILSQQAKLLEFKKCHDEEFYKERESKRYKIELKEIRKDNKIDTLKSTLKELKKDFRKALVIFNTIDDAIKFYKCIEGERKVLIHSRFSDEDRKKKAAEVETMSEGIVVGTQAVEAGLDFSSDLIISELCPANSLIQRFGRFLRKDEKEGKAIVWYEEGKEDEYMYKVYEGDLVRRTLDYLSSNQDVNLHIGYERFLDYVYRSPPKVDYNLMEKIVNVITNLSNPSESAIDLLIKMDGSLVREGDVLTALSRDGVEVPVNFSYVKKNCVKAFNGNAERNCPRSEKEAIIYSLEGFKYKVNSAYTEVGLP